MDRAHAAARAAGADTAITPEVVKRDRRGARHAARRLHRRTRGCSRCWSAAATMAVEGGIDWGIGETARLRLAAACEGVPVRLAGQDSRRGTFVPAARGARRPRDRRGVHAADAPRRGPGASSASTTRCCREYAAMGFEYGYSVASPDALVLLGGAVRRLRQRRADDHRRVHLLRRAEVGPALRRHAAAAARLRGPGPGPLVRPDRAVPAAVRRGQHDGRHAARPRRTTSTCCAGRRYRPHAPAAGRLHPEVAAAAQGRRRRAVEDFTDRHASSRCIARPGAARAGRA